MVRGDTRRPSFSSNSWPFAPRPMRVLASYLTDQMLEVGRNHRPARWAFPTPEKLKALAVPTNEGFGRHHSQCAAPIEPAAEPQEGQACWMGGSAGPDSAFLVERKLFAQKE